MSDNIKLIIEMPKEDYEFTKGAKTARVYPSEYYVKLILNGIPLDENKGEWIPVYGKNGKTIMSYKCSKCDFHPKHAIITDFCGGCGADMRGEE